MGHHARRTACLLTEKPQTNAKDACVCATLLIIPPGAQTDPRRFFLPFDHHLRKITEVAMPSHLKQMDIRISRESPIPLRQQLAEQIVFLIVTDKLRAGQALPSV